jgi:hypothetical protein
MDLHDKVIERLAAPAIPTGQIIQAGEAAHDENLTVLLYRLVGTWQLGEKVGLVERCWRRGDPYPNRVSAGKQARASSESLAFTPRLRAQGRHDSLGPPYRTARPPPACNFHGSNGRDCRAAGTRRLGKSYPNYEIFYRGGLTPVDRLLRCR